MNIKEPYRLIISGGGTGGHIFPAISIANEFRERHPNADILFVGAKGKMEMVRVPEAGYKIVGLWISGLQRKLTVSNLLFPVKLIISYFKASRIIHEFKPHAVVGTGGYASGPIMLSSTRKGIPSLIQEQNSYAGLTNKRLSSRVQMICVAYPGMEKYFPKDKILLTGNPVRKDIVGLESKRLQAQEFFGLDPKEKTLLILGGSLGARTINETVLAGLDLLIGSKVQVIWQTGKIYYDNIKERVSHKNMKGILVFDFLKQMDLAYAASDVVVSRAGALAISELSMAHRPCILVPSPHVAEDHQTQNALALVRENAALMIKDAEAHRMLIDRAILLLSDQQQCENLKLNITRLARPAATREIVNEIDRLIEGSLKTNLN